MGAGAAAELKWPVYLQLGRVSNLPTVWTNVLAGTTLVGGATAPGRLAVLMFAFSLFYAGGMYLNDAFDREIDARERPDRPIPSGRIRAREVFAIGFGMLALALLVLMVGSVGWTNGSGWPAMGSGIVLTGLIIGYDAWHKQNPLSPLLMGLCRVLVYVTAALAVAGRVGSPVIGGAAILLSYLVGLTYVARQENLAEVRNRWPLAFLGAPFVYGLPTLLGGPVGAVVYLGVLGWVCYGVSLLVRKGRLNVRRAVVSMIAGISLVDALLIAAVGDAARAGWAILGFALTLICHRWVPGT